MFQLSSIKDTIPVHPSDFGLPAQEALTAELNKKYANKVLHNVGLGVCVFDIVEVGDGNVRYGDGFLWYKRLCIFMPLRWSGSLTFNSSKIQTRRLSSVYI